MATYTIAFADATATRDSVQPWQWWGHSDRTVEADSAEAALDAALTWAAPTIKMADYGGNGAHILARVEAIDGEPVDDGPQDWVYVDFAAD